MLRNILTAVVALALATPCFAAVPADSVKGQGRPQSVGLVLSGGGAKGIAHIGVIKAFEDNDIPIDYITGTSMGAIVGGLYACGYTPEEMMELLRSQGFSYWSQGKNDPDLMYYFARQTPQPVLFDIPVSMHRKKGQYTAADSVPASLINALPMNFAFMDLFSAYTAQCGGDFDKLFVPFRCIASDVEANRKVVHRSGSVGECIRSSMSFPLVFQPLKFNGVYLYDGGLFDNFPYDVMTQDFAPDIMVGVSVGSSASGPQTSLMDQIDNIAMRPQGHRVPDSLGISIRINLDQFSLLDFPACDEIYRIGYEHGMKCIDSIKRRVTARMPRLTREANRMAFKARTPYVRFKSVEVTGGTPHQNEYLRYIFEPAKADTFGIVHARESYYRAVSSGRISDLLPRAEYDDSTGLFDLKVQAAPKNDCNIGIGGFISSSTQSFLFLSANYSTLSFTSLNAGLNAWLGQSYMAAQLNVSKNLHTSIPSALGVTGVVSRQRYLESDRLFFEDTRPSFIVSHEYYGRAFYNWAAGAGGKFSFGVGYGHIYDSFFRLDTHADGEPAYRDHTTLNLGQARFGYTSSTLDQENFPTRGHDYNFVLMGLMGNFRYKPGTEGLVSGESAGTGAHAPYAYECKPRWLQLQLRSRNYWSLGKKWAFGVEGDALLSTRKLTGGYDADIVNAAVYEPTIASHNQFNRRFRANSYLAATLVPIYKFNDSFTTRLTLSTFVPMRRILPGSAFNGETGRYDRPWGSHYSGWFGTARFYGELDVCYALPIPGVVTAYVNYTSSGVRPWGVGLSLGIYLHAPKFLE